MCSANDASSSFFRLPPSLSTEQLLEWELFGDAAIPLFSLDLDFPDFDLLLDLDLLPDLFLDLDFLPDLLLDLVFLLDLDLLLDLLPDLDLDFFPDLDLSDLALLDKLLLLLLLVSQSLISLISLPFMS